MSDPSLAQVVAQLDRLTAQMRRFEIFLEIRNRGSLAPEEDYTDETVRFCPRTWPGDRVDKGTRLSQCSPSFLLHYGDTLDQLAAKQRQTAEQWFGAPSWRSNEVAARRARRWAYRLANSVDALEDLASPAAFPTHPARSEEVEPTSDPDYITLLEPDTL